MDVVNICGETAFPNERCRDTLGRRFPRCRPRAARASTPCTLARMSRTRRATSARRCSSRCCTLQRTRSRCVRPPSAHTESNLTHQLHRRQSKDTQIEMLNQMVGRCEKELTVKDEKIAELEGVSRAACWQMQQKKDPHMHTRRRCCARIQPTRSRHSAHCSLLRSRRTSSGCERRWILSRRSSIATSPSRRLRAARSSGARSPHGRSASDGACAPSRRHAPRATYHYSRLPSLCAPRSSGAAGGKAVPAKAAGGTASGASTSTGTATGLPPPPTLGVAAPADGSALMSYVSSGSGSSSRAVPDGTCAVRPEVISVRGGAVPNGG